MVSGPTYDEHAKSTEVHVVCGEGVVEGMSR